MSTRCFRIICKGGYSMNLLDRIFGSYSEKELAKIEPIKKKVLDLDEEYKGLSDASLKAKTTEFRERLANGETLDDIMVEALPLLRDYPEIKLALRGFGVLEESLRKRAEELGDENIVFYPKFMDCMIIVKPDFSSWILEAFSCYV